VDSDGNWTAGGANLSSWSDGTITVKATGSNQHGIAADEVTSKADLVTTKPIVSNVTLNPINPSNGDSVQVTIRFNENVSDVSGSLGQPIDFSSVTAPTNEWVGTISSLNVGVESKKDLIVSAGYKDTSGNFGDEYTEQVNVTPVIVLNTISDDYIVGSSDSNSLLITGVSTGFSNGDRLEVKAQSINEITEVFNQTVQIQSDGTWSTTAEDISGWNNSDVTVTVDGTNNSGVHATTVDKSITLNNSIVFLYRDHWINKKAA
jgi:hypothetical protein